MSGRDKIAALGLANEAYVMKLYSLSSVSVIEIAIEFMDSCCKKKAAATVTQADELPDKQK